MEDHWVGPDGRLIDPFRRGMTHRASSPHELRALTVQHLRAVKRAVEGSTVLVFTLGLTEAWISIADRAVFPACPGTVAGEFDSRKHRFHNFSYEETAADLDRMIPLLRSINPQLKIIITVSPVPLVATATGRHVLTATTYCKSVLRVAANEVVRRHADVAYFPAYELVLGPQPRESPFAPDLRTVREPVIATVMTAFMRTFIDPSDETAGGGYPAADGLLSDLVAAALNDDCEEMMADKRMWVEATSSPSAADSRA